MPSASSAALFKRALITSIRFRTPAYADGCFNSSAFGGVTKRSKVLQDNASSTFKAPWISISRITSLPWAICLFHIALWEYRNNDLHNLAYSISSCSSRSASQIPPSERKKYSLPSSSPCPAAFSWWQKWTAHNCHERLAKSSFIRVPLPAPEKSGYNQPKFPADSWDISCSFISIRCSGSVRLPFQSPSSGQWPCPKAPGHWT